MTPDPAAQRIKFETHSRPRQLSFPTSSLMQAIIDAHIAKAAQDVLDTLPQEIERLERLGHTEIAQKLRDFQEKLQGLYEETAP